MSDYAAIVHHDDCSTRCSTRPQAVLSDQQRGRQLLLRVGERRRPGRGHLLCRREHRATIAVGDHPQRMRMGVMRSELLPPSSDRVAPRITRARVAGGVLRLRLSEDARLRVVVQRPRGGRWRATRVLLRRDARAGTVRVPLGAAACACASSSGDHGNRRRWQPLRAQARALPDARLSPRSSITLLAAVLGAVDRSFAHRFCRPSVPGFFPDGAVPGRDAHRPEHPLAPARRPVAGDRLRDRRAHLRHRDRPDPVRDRRAADRRAHAVAVRLDRRARPHGRRAVGSSATSCGSSSAAGGSRSRTSSRGSRCA